MSKLISTDTVL